jgi:nucleoside-diphosphate-sugar epimerase
MAPNRPLPPADLDHILHHTQSLFPALKSQRLFLTGGTGFFGHWLLESFLHANRHLSLNAHATVLTRNAQSFRTRSPHIAEDPAITLLEADVRTFPFPAEPHTHIIHAATDSGGQQTNRPAYDLAESILEGTRQTLRFALSTGATRLLYTSTGAVYGRNLTGLTHIPETTLTAPDPLALTSSYDESKRMSEHLCTAYAHSTPLEVSIARCFAFVGPHLPLDAHYAIGNFIRDAIANTPIRILGDGTPLRSYLYTADLAIWLWTLLFQAPANRAYNVGSEDQHTIADTARITAQTLRPTLPIDIAQTPTLGTPIPTYVPSTQRAHHELNLTQHISLEEAMRRTAAWHDYTPT